MKKIDNVLFRLLKIYISLKVIYFLILFYFILYVLVLPQRILIKKIKKNNWPQLCVIKII